MKLIEWIKDMFSKEWYVCRVEDAQKRGMTYLPELHLDCKMRWTPRDMSSLDIFLAGGWRNK